MDTITNFDVIIVGIGLFIVGCVVGEMIHILINFHRRTNFLFKNKLSIFKHYITNQTVFNKNVLTSYTAVIMIPSLTSMAVEICTVLLCQNFQVKKEEIQVQTINKFSLISCVLTTTKDKEKLDKLDYVKRNSVKDIIVNITGEELT